MRARLLLPLVLLTASGCDAEAVRRAPGIGDPAPEYSSTTLEGGEASLASLRGEVVLLNVWATWCPPCREEIPALQALHEEHAGRGLRVVGVSIDGRGERESIRAFLAGFGVSYDIWHDPDERVSGVFRTQGVPTTVLIDREGTLRWRHVGPVTADDPELLRQIEASL